MSGDPEPVAVVGAGGEGLALAAHLSAAGHAVTICTRDPRRVAGIVARRRIRVSGELDGEFPVVEVDPVPASALRGCRLVFVATVTTAYPAVAARLAPVLTESHVVVLFSGKLCGSAEFARALADAGAPGVDVVETDALFAARPDGEDGVRVHGRKRWNLFAGLTLTAARRHEDLLRGLFPGIEPAQHLIERGLVDFGAVAHAPIALVNLARIDGGERLLLYRDGMSERTVVLLERIGQEFVDVGEAYEAKVPALHELLDLYYGCPAAGTVLEAMRTVKAYADITAPTSLDHRMLQEDVSCTLVPMIELAQRVGVKTPVAEAVVTFASVLAGRDYRSEGRTLARLGWHGLSGAEILDRLRA